MNMSVTDTPLTTHKQSWVCLGDKNAYAAGCGGRPPETLYLSAVVHCRDHKAPIAATVAGRA